MVLRILTAPKFICPDHSFERQTFTSSCCLLISKWIFNKHIKINKSEADLLVCLPVPLNTIQPASQPQLTATPPLQRCEPQSRLLSFIHTPQLIHRQILSAIPSRYVQDPTAYHLYCYRHGPDSLLDYCMGFIIYLRVSVPPPCPSRKILILWSCV